MHHFSPLFQMGPARRDHIPAFRTALGVAIPMFTLLALGRMDLAIYANFGARKRVSSAAETGGSTASTFQPRSLSPAAINAASGAGSVSAMSSLVERYLPADAASSTSMA